MAFVVRLVRITRIRLRRACRGPRKRGRIVAGAAALAVAGVGWLAVSSNPEVTSVARGGRAHVTPQVKVHALMLRLGARIAAPWVDRRAVSGLFVDPITGAARPGYGPAMLAEVLIRDGAHRKDRRMLRAGLKALSANATRAAEDGRPGNPLELLAIASAYRWADRNLSGDADWQRFARGPREYLRTWESAAVGRAARRCFASGSCWNNYKIVGATGVLLLLDTGLRPGSRSSRLGHPAGARAAALSILERDRDRARRRGARRGRRDTWARAPLGPADVSACVPRYVGRCARAGARGSRGSSTGRGA